MKTNTQNLLQIIGSPFIEESRELPKVDLDELHEYSKQNRMPLLYLKSILELGVKDNYYEGSLKLIDQWSDIEKRIKKVTNILDLENVEYATFKSIKPYREVTVDIDLLIYDKYELTVSKLKEEGYILLEKGPLSSTFRDPEVRIDYDIYDEVGVSYIIYYDKDKVKQTICDKSLQSGELIKSLTPVNDLLAVIAHSVIKEQMYILAEYYSTLFFLKNMDNEQLDDFIEMAEKLKLKNAVQAHIGITHYMHNQIHGQTPDQLEKIVSVFGVNQFEIERLQKTGMNMPHKFNMRTLSKSFYEKMWEGKARRSYLSQFLHMLDPRFLADFIPKFLSHVQRKTY